MDNGVYVRNLHSICNFIQNSSPIASYSRSSELDRRFLLFLLNNLSAYLYMKLFVLLKTVEFSLGNESLVAQSVHTNKKRHLNRELYLNW